MPQLLEQVWVLEKAISGAKLRGWRLGGLSCAEQIRVAAPALLQAPAPAASTLGDRQIDAALLCAVTGTGWRQVQWPGTAH